MSRGRIPSRRRWHRSGRIVLFGLALILAGCQTASYYSQAIRGQAQVLRRQHSIASLLQDPATPGSLKAKLRLVLELRVFAEKELLLPANGHYLSYTDLGRPFAVWNVHAAPEFSLTPKSWWYPIVGSLEYRGYFAEADARRYAARLKAQGYDVHLAGVTAYSTLGWFKDPVLNTFITDTEPELAELLFHELTHQRLFVSGDTEFNEALATAVAEEGVRRWLGRRGDPPALRSYDEDLQRTEQFVALLASARARLEELYAEPSASSPLAARRERKARIQAELRQDYARLRERWGGNDRYDRWFAKSLNNAQLNTVDTYYRLVPAFREILKDQGGDLETFFRITRALGRKRKEARHAELLECAAKRRFGSNGQ